MRFLLMKEEQKVGPVLWCSIFMTEVADSTHP